MNVGRGIASVASVTPLLAFVLLLQGSAPASAKQTWRVTNLAPTARIHLRQQPNNHSTVIAYIAGNARGLSAGPCDDGWCLVEYQGLEGYMFARYLAREDPEPQESNPIVPTSAQIQALAAKKILQLAKRDGAPISVYAFPNDQLPVAGNLPAGTEAVQGLGSCIRDWCYVRSGELVGWVKTDAFAVEDNGKDQGVTAALSTTVTSDENKTLNKIEPTATNTSVQASATIAALGNPETKSYTLAGLGGESSLAMREQPDGTSRILGWIPNGATDVEGLHKCIEQWCLVRHGGVSGWVARRHLADASVESSQLFQAKGMELWGSLNVLDYPNAHANVVGKIPSYATGIVPIGGCDDEWCHVRYLGIAGWVSGQYLEPQPR